jgi:hypothetical protein
MEVNVGDVTVVEGNDLYEHYFKAFPKISKLISQLADNFFGDKVGGIAKKAITNILARLEYSSQVLHRKYAFSHASLIGEKLSIASSGFPNKSEINGMFADLVNLAESKERLAPVDVHKLAWLDKANETGTDDPNLLWRIGGRLYIDMLDKKKMMLPIVFGSLTKDGKNAQGEQNYVFWWACYSSTTDSPTIHVLEMTQDCSEEVDPLDKNGQSYEQFLRVIQETGSRTPLLSLLAYDIDVSLPNVHPKRLTRLSMENLYTATSEFGERDHDEKERCSFEYFSRFAEPDELMVRMYLDVIASKGTSNVGSLFGQKQKREIFDINDEDLLASERGTTSSCQYLLLPHRMVQIANSDQGGFLGTILDSEAVGLLTYTREGMVNAI